MLAWYDPVSGYIQTLEGSLAKGKEADDEFFSAHENLLDQVSR
jgi:hypothetical protein